MKIYNLSEILDHHEIRESGWEMKLIGRLSYYTMLKLLEYKLLILDLSDCMIEKEKVSSGGGFVIHGKAYSGESTYETKDVFMELLKEISVDTLIVPEYISEDQLKIASENKGIGKLIVKSVSLTNNEPSERIIFDRPNPIIHRRARYNTKDLYGYKNADGSWVLKPQFNEASDFIEGTAIVKNDTGYGLIDIHGNYIIEPTYPHLNFRNGIALISKDGKMGCINKEGKLLLEQRFSYLQFFPNKSGWGIAKEEDKFFLIEDYKIRDFDQEIQWAQLCHNYLLVKINEKWGTLDQNFNWLIHPVIEDFKDNGWLITIQKDGKYGKLNENGSFGISPIYDEIPEHVYGPYHKVVMNGKVGLVKPNEKGGEIRIPITNDSIEYNDQNFFIRKDGKEGVIVFNYNGEIEYNIPPVFQKVIVEKINKDYKKGKIVKIKSGEYYGLLDHKGNVIIEPIHTEISASILDLFIVNDNGKLGLIHKTKGMILQPNFDEIIITEPGYVKFRSKDKWGLGDLTGIIVNPLYENISKIVYKNQVAVKVKGNWGLIDTDGNWLLKPKYEGIGFNNEDLVPVKVNGLWGFVNKSGKLIIKPEFTNVGAFNNRYAWVEKNRRIGAINTKGEYIFKLKAMDKYNRDQFKQKFRQISGPISNSGLKFKEGKWLFPSQKSKIKILPMEIQDFIASEHSIEFQSGGLWGSMDLEGQVLFFPKFLKISPIGNKLYIFEENDKYGWCNSKGQIMMPNTYDEVDYYLFEDNYLIFYLNGEKKYFLITDNNLLEVKLEDIDVETKDKLEKYLNNDGYDDDWLEIQEEIHRFDQVIEQKNSILNSPYPVSIKVLS